MMENAQTDIDKMFDAIRRVRKTLQCAVCKKIPTDATTPKCGHLFCTSCLEKVLHSKKAVCLICKTVIIRSSLRKVVDIEKWVKVSEKITDAIFEDSGIDRASLNILDRTADESQMVRPSQGKPGSVKIRPSTSRDDTILSSRTSKRRTRNTRTSTEVRETTRCESVFSEKTTKIDRGDSNNKNKEPLEPSESKSNDSKIFMISPEKLAAKEKPMEPEEKVGLWLSSEGFETNAEIAEDFPETRTENFTSNSTRIGENFDSCSQTRRRDSALVSSARRSKSPLFGDKSRASNPLLKKQQNDDNVTDKNRKYRSFSLGLKNHSQTSKPRVVTPAEKMFDELCSKKSGSEKSAAVLASTKGSWSEMVQFGKETRSKIRKRRRLNISIGKPDASVTKLTLESEEDSKEEQSPEAFDPPTAVDTGKKSTENSVEKIVGQTGLGRKSLPNIVSSKTLEKNEMINFPTLNKRQVKEIIGVGLTESDLDQSKTSNISPDKLPVESTRTQLPQPKSNEHDRNTSNESVPPDDRAAHVSQSVRPQSRQSFRLSNSRPDSRLSMKSPFKPGTPEKFRLSTNREPLTTKAGCTKISPKQDETEVKKIVFTKESPVRTCNDFERNKLSLRKLSSDRDKNIVSIKKLGRLSKTRSRFKFLKLGVVKSQNTSIPLILTRDVQTQTNITILFEKMKFNNAQTQTNFEPRNSENATSDRPEKMVGNELPLNRQIRRSCSSSIASNGLEKLSSSINSTATRTKDLLKPNTELDTINKVNMLPPEEDSQLKYLEINSPSMIKGDFLDVEHATEDTDELFEAKKRNDSVNFIGGASEEDNSEYMKEVKNYADKLIVTDSEDPDTVIENHSRNKRKSDRRMDLRSSNEETSVGIASSSKMRGWVNAGVSQHLKNSDISASPKRKKLSIDSLDSDKKKKKKKKSSESEASGSKKNRDSNLSVVENIPLRKTTNENGTKILQDSETSIASSKHRVVRKLQYSQESSSSQNIEPRQIESSSNREKQRKPAGESPEKKTFQRIRSISSSESDSELMKISLSTKPSGTTSSQNTLKLRASPKTKKSCVPDEEISVEFSSNRDSPEPKRKRTLSPNSLDNVDLHAIASDWCADLDRSSEEIAAENTKVLGTSSGHAVKKPEFERRRSSASNSSDDFPSFNANTKSNVNLGKARNQNSVSEVVKVQNSSHPASVTNSISKKNEVNCSSGVRIENTNSFNYEMAKNSFPARNNPRSSPPSGNIEMGDTLNDLITPEKNLIPGRSRTSQLSHNSNKENEMGDSQAKSWVEKRVAISENVGNTIASSEDLSKSVKAVDQPLSKSGSISQREKSTSNAMLFDSCSDQDFLNITQEQMQLQEIEDNLLGRNSNAVNGKTSQIKITEMKEEDVERTLRAEKPSENKVAGQTGKGNAIAEPDSEDSVTINEDIVESTPQKNFPPKKDPQNNGDCSQRSIMSRKSFMSVDMTPIPKTFGRRLEKASEISPLLERGVASKMSIQQRGSSLTGNIHPSCHSTPKPSGSIKVSRLTTAMGSNETVDKKNRRLCFISSCITPKQVDGVKAFARLHGAEFTTNYKPEVTHVIVPANSDNSASRTLKYLLGIAHQNWIVSFRWVTDSISQGRLLQEDNYEVVDSESLEPGAKRSRLRKRGLFDYFAFFCTDPFTEITASQMKDLIISIGGSITQSLGELIASTRKYKILLYNSSITDEDKLAKLRQRGGFLPVPFEWVFTCICEYELTSICPFIPPKDRELALDLGFPAELLVEVDESDSGNEESASDIAE